MEINVRKDTENSNKLNWKYSLATAVLGLGIASAVCNSLYAENTPNSKQSLETKAVSAEKEKAVEQRAVSANGISLIKKYEGFSPKVYDDVGFPAIGYGHRLEPGENFKEINEQKAVELLKGDLKEAQQTVDKYVKVPLNQNQYDALCSFVYNLGEQNLARSTLLKKLNSKDYAGASKEFEKWINSNGKPLEGLKKRRAEENQLFLAK